MPVTTIKASLVGMKYHGVGLDEAARCLTGQTNLRREPNNMHDKNAIAVVHKDRVLGHIDRASAAIIAPLIDDGASSQVSIDTLKQRSRGSIPVTVRIDGHLRSTTVPTICEVEAIGIYRIFIKDSDRCYIGQSVNIRNRIRQHWDELGRGTHLNSELRREWRSRNPADFLAEVLERAPSGLNGLELARWLVERERAWIDAFGGLQKTINVEEPKIVLDHDARSSLDIERRNHEQELRTLDDRAESLLAAILKASDRADVARRQIKEASVFWGIFASSEIKNKARVAQNELPEILENISMLQAERQKVNDILYGLRRRLFLI
ncbi:HIRAN domain-containing protein [Sphingopyxis sp. J-6]|uniref:HIRAN domain-containing protein n=1 Tax=Sphingopyxis sp. J-6 TaxID=3122054 RepID=UPI00398453CA